MQHKLCFHATSVAYRLRGAQSATTAEMSLTRMLHRQNAGCRTIVTTHVHTGNKHVQLVETVVSLVYICVSLVCTCAGLGPT